MSENPSDVRFRQIVRSGGKLKTKQKRVQVRKTAQQTLLYLNDIISQHNQRYYTTDEGFPKINDNNYAEWVGSDPSLGGDDDEDERGPSWRSGYRNIIPIEKGDGFKDGISSLVSLGTDLTKFFTFDLTSAQQAALSPKIRLFKVEYELGPDGQVVLPFKEKMKREIIFEKAITTDEITILKDRGGNLGSSGIESFEWALKGVNPAEIDSNIEASLKVYFNNVGVFQDRLDKLADLTAATQIATAAATAHAAAVEHGSAPAAVTTAATLPAAAAGVIAATAAVSEKAHFMDLITFAPPTTTTTSQLPCLEEYQPHFFEVMAEVGWDIADEGLKGLFTSQQREYVRKQTVKLYLTLSDHKFDFKEDGSATLTVNYRARQTFSDARYDILNPPFDLVDKLALIDKLKTSPGVEGGEDKSSELQDAQSEAALLRQENYKKIVDALLKNLYVAYMPGVLTLNEAFKYQTVTVTAKIKDAYSTLSYDQLLELMSLVNTTGDGYLGDDIFGDWVTSSSLKPLLETIRAVSASPIHVRRAETELDMLGKIADRTLDVDDILMDDAALGRWGGAASDLGYRGRGGRGDGSKTQTRIKFFYLGDILEVLLETIPIASDIALKKLAFVVTDFEYLNLLKLIEATATNNEGDLELRSGQGTRLQNFDFSALQCGEKSLSPDQRKQFYSNINLANVPIEASAFLDFFTDKIISQNRTNYYLNSFLADMFTSLIKPLLGSTSILGMPSNQPSLLSLDISAVDTNKTPLFADNHMGLSVPRTVPSTPDTQYQIGTSDEEEEFIYISTIQEYLNKSSPVFVQNPPSSQSNNTATVKLIGINSGVKTLRGIYGENVTQGIANFVVGLDRGLIKAVSFERVDQPYLREARVAREKSFGVGQLRELYHANLTLYGNNLLKPGQTIYVEPNRLIFGSPASKKSVARVLGLGGYHLVVDVSHTIGVDGWETTVKALHMAMPAIPD